MAIPLDKSYIKKVGVHIRKLRTDKGISKGELAIRIESHRSLIASIERGDTNTTINTLKAIADVLEVEPKDLLVF